MMVIADTQSNIVCPVNYENTEGDHGTGCMCGQPETIPVFYLEEEEPEKITNNFCLHCGKYHDLDYCKKNININNKISFEILRSSPHRSSVSDMSRYSKRPLRALLRFNHKK